MGIPRPTSRPGFAPAACQDAYRGRGGEGREPAWEQTRHGPRREARSYVPKTEANGPSARTSNTEGPPHQPRLAKDVART